MSNLLSEASLVLIPSGIKASKVYAQIPEDGSGDMTFARASDSTRVNSLGLVEKVRTNLVTYSNDFSTSWALVNATKSTGQTGPFGSTDAIKLKYDTTPGGAHYITQGQSNSNAVTQSVYAKAGEVNFLQIASAQSIEEYANFNLSTGVVGTKGSYASLSSIESVGNGWYRCSVTLTNGTNGVYIAIVDSASSGWFAINGYAGANNTDGIYLWGAQLEVSDFGPTAYIPTTSSAVSVGPYSNIPRLTYQNGGGGCPSLLLEKQSTNLALYSEQFDNAAWTKYESTITANATTSPDGTQNADLLLDNSSTDAHSAYQVITASAGTLTWSVYAKAQNNNFLIISAYTGSHNRTWFNLSTGAVGTNASGNTATIENMGNGWYRCIVSRAYVSGTLVHEVGISKTDGVFSYTGNGADGVYIYGAQLEASSYPTSYINTTSASATRVADECYKTGISSLIGQSEGFLFGEVKGIATTYPSKSVIMSVNDGTSLNRVELSFNATTGYLTPRIYKAGSTIFVSDYYIGDVTQKFKFAIGYGGGRAVFYVNGTSIHETTGLTFFSSGTLTKLGNDNYNGSELGYGFVSQYILGTTNLTNSQLAELTA